MSQMELASRADISARHLSFVETGRSKPSREVILRLAAALDLPLRGRNQLLVAAGFAPLYSHTAVVDLLSDAGAEADAAVPGVRGGSPLEGEAEIASIGGAIDLVLSNHEPYSAVVIDRAWNVLRSNRPHEILLDIALGGRGIGAATRDNLLRLVFDPAALRPAIVNWDVVARTLIDRLHGEVAAWNDPRLISLLEEALAYPDVPARWAEPDLDAPASLLVPIHIRSAGLELRLFNTLMTLGTPRDVTLDEIRVELFFPADPASDRVIRAVAGPTTATPGRPPAFSPATPGR